MYGNIRRNHRSTNARELRRRRASEYFLKEPVDNIGLNNDEPTSIAEISLQTILDEEIATDIQVCHGHLAMTLNNVVCSSSPCFIKDHGEQQGGEAGDMSMVDEKVGVATAPKSSRKPRVSNGGPLRRSKRLAARNLRRSRRIAEKHLITRP